jgi:hypothetical protein
MRIGQFVFHVECFGCVACSRTLHRGDAFGMRDDGSVYCQRHFQPGDLQTTSQANRSQQKLKSESSVALTRPLHDAASAPPTPNSPSLSHFSNQNLLLGTSFFPLQMQDDSAGLQHMSRGKSNSSRCRRRKTIPETFDQMTQQDHLIDDSQDTQQQHSYTVTNISSTGAGVAGQTVQPHFTSSKVE